MPKAFSDQDIVTQNPPTPHPPINCPWCGEPLTYRHTIYQGGSPTDRRDVFLCAAHGGLEFDHPTGALRPSAERHTR